MLSLFTWNDTFLTQIPLVDEQHQGLVGLINQLGELVISRDALDSKSVMTIRNTILDYASVHFKDEESLLADVGVDSRHIQRHQSEHQLFIKEALSLSEMTEEHGNPNIRNLVDYLVRWLAYHILDIDQSMARQIRAIKAGQSPAEAFELEERSGLSKSNPLLQAMSGLFYVVSERNHELRELNRELEERVQQRTAELEHANQQLQLLSTHDELTGLPNRRFSFISMNQLWAQKQRYNEQLSVLMIDADHFKEVNDRFGHEQGDALLRTLAEHLRLSVRASDVVCRLGGDEFLVICPKTTHAGATIVAQNILASSKPFYTSQGVECWNGALSIGIAESDDNMTQPEDLVRAADQAMYNVKRKKKSTTAA